MRSRRAKIVATIGPASSSKDMLAKLFEAGVDVFRINMSHTSHDLMKTLVDRIRQVEKEALRPIGILVDLQGPKLRVAKLPEEGVDLEVGASFTFDRNEDEGDINRVHLPHPEIFASVKAGDALLLNDGRIRLRATETSDHEIKATVEVGGNLTSNKGVSLPDTLLPVTAMTDKDRSDLEYAITQEIDWVALSFVQRPEDILDVRKIAGYDVAIMAKIEKPAAVNRLSEILEASDGLMVARGDLGVELPLEKVPGIQKQMTRAARRAGKPVVVATQMLESMISSPAPTRAEVSDVATAVFEGADAVMLSAESAVGDYPIETVTVMSNIATEVEQDPYYKGIIHAQRTDPLSTSADAISAALRQISDTLDLAAIVCYTSSGSTGLRAARERPNQPIIALTPRTETGRRLALVWGLHCVITEDAKDEAGMVNRAGKISYMEGFAKPGDRIIISAGVPFGTPGTTNMLRVAYVDYEGKTS